MAVMGESAAPTGSDLLRLAVDAGLELGWAQAVVEEIAEHGALFTALAKTAPIRAASVKAISRAIEANRLRMLD
jgi:serine/threonine-protein kinase HipA